MSDNFQTINKFTTNQIDAMGAVAGVFARNAEKIFAETKDFSVTTYRNQSALISKMISAKSLSELMLAQTEHARAHYEASVGEAKKISEILTDLATDTIKSVLKKAPEGAAAQPASSKPELVKPQGRVQRSAA